MISKHMALALIGSAFLATAAMAQTTTTTSPTTPQTAPTTMDKSTTDKSTMDKSAMDKSKTAPSTTAMNSEAGYHGDWRASKVIGLNVYNESNEKLGSISELLFDKSGSVKAAVIGVGGFLGVGQHDVAVEFDKLKFVDTPVPSTSASTSSTSKSSSGTTTGAAPSTTTTTTTTTKSNPWYPDHAVFNATKDQLKSMSEFKYST